MSADVAAPTVSSNPAAVTATGGNTRSLRWLWSGGLLMLLADMTTFTTGQDLAAMCRKDRAACLRYIEGGSDMVTGLQANRSMPSMICVPASAAGPDLVNTVSAFLAAHPESLDQGAGGLLWAALYDAYPCPTDGR